MVRTDSSEPEKSASTAPSRQLLIQPSTPSSTAAISTHARYPTPCTRPRIMTRKITSMRIPHVRLRRLRAAAWVASVQAKQCSRAAIATPARRRSQVPCSRPLPALRRAAAPDRPAPSGGSRRGSPARSRRGRVQRQGPPMGKADAITRCDLPQDAVDNGGALRDDRSKAVRRDREAIVRKRCRTERLRLRRVPAHRHGAHIRTVGEMQHYAPSAGALGRVAAHTVTTNASTTGTSAINSRTATISHARS